MSELKFSIYVTQIWIVFWRVKSPKMEDLEGRLYNLGIVDADFGR